MNHSDYIFVMAVFAIIVAAGEGRRFGGLKQFVDLNGKPILFQSVEIFEKNQNIDSIVVVVPERMVEKTKKLVKIFGYKKIYKVVPGGKRRQDSVLNGLIALGNRNGLVAIHDGVRPFVSQELVNRGIKLCRKYKAVVFGIPVFDTLKLVKGKKVITTVPRISPCAVQTPQFFDIKYLRQAFERVDFKNEFTDEASILECAGMDVYLFKGEKNNIKITTRRDLEILKKKL